MTNELYQLKCVQTGKVVDESVAYTTHPTTKKPLEVNLNYDLISKRLNRHALKLTPLKATKYVDFYPIHDKRKIISLGAGGTPLYHCENLGKLLGMKHLYIKYEGANPTGAFKDRGTMVEVTKAIELGKKAIVVASTGNMAASVSAYCAKAKIPVYVIVPQGTPIGKLSQTLAYGARIIQVRGKYDDAARLAEEIAKKHNFYLAGDYAFRVEGQKSQSFEIVEQLNWSVPDNVIVPIGCGTNASAIWKGFKEYKQFGLIDSLPRLIGVQATGAAPVVDAFKKKQKSAKPIDNPTTIASAMCVGDPLDGDKVLKALYESNGLAVAVDDDAMLESEKLLAKTESFFVEPSAAATLTTLQLLLAQGKIKKDEKTVLILTGQGLKDPVSALKVLYTPPVVDPELSEVQKYLEYGFYDVVASKTESKKVLLAKKPTVKQLAVLIKKEFNTELHKDDLKKSLLVIEEFLQKGKKILKGDLQYVLEKTLRESVVKKRILKVIDFKVESGLKSKPKGFVKIRFKGKTVTKESKGTGPVDSIISAIKKVTNTNGFKVNLADYEVNITEGGTEASTNVKMTLKDRDGNKIIAMGTSPDIIVASVEAFEEGYNLLYFKNKKK